MRTKPLQSLPTATIADYSFFCVSSFFYITCYYTYYYIPSTTVLTTTTLKMQYTYILSMLVLITAPPSPGCMPVEGVLLVGKDRGASTLTLVHILGEASVAQFKSGKTAKALTTVIGGIQRIYPVSYHCAMCFGSYIQCGALTPTCTAACTDFKTDECKTCLANECGQNLLRCSRAPFLLPTAEL